MTNNITSDDARLILAYSKELSEGWKHGFIHYDHLFIAMLQNECFASQYLNKFDGGLWTTNVKNSYPSRDVNPAIANRLPLTIAAESVIRHAAEIAAFHNSKLISSVDLLLAILSFENRITHAFNADGMCIEDISLGFYKKAVKKYTRDIKPINTIPMFFFSNKEREKKVTELYQNATDLFTYGLFEDCANVCKTALSVSASNIEIRRLLADCCIARRDFESSLQLLIELVKEKPEDFGQQVSLASVYDRLGHFDEGANILDELLLKHPDNTTCLNNRGFNFFEQGKYAEAIPFFEKASRIDPLFAYAWNNLGFSKYKLGDTENGLIYINKSLELDKGNSFAYKHKAIIFMALGNKEEALHNFNLALKFNYTALYGDEVLQLMNKIT